MTETEHTAQQQLDDRSFMAKLLAGEYGLASTYWILYFVGAALFFLFW